MFEKRKVLNEFNYPNLHTDLKFCLQSTSLKEKLNFSLIFHLIIVEMTNMVIPVVEFSREGQGLSWEFEIAGANH